MWPRQSRGHIKWFLYRKYKTLIRLLKSNNFETRHVFITDSLLKLSKNTYHENRGKILYRTVILISEIDMKPLELWSNLLLWYNSIKRLQSSHGARVPAQHICAIPVRFFFSYYEAPWVFVFHSLWKIRVKLDWIMLVLPAFVLHGHILHVFMPERWRSTEAWLETALLLAWEDALQSSISELTQSVDYWRSTSSATCIEESWRNSQ